MSGPRALLAAGGTGGHLFPALALATELKKRGWQVHLVTDKRARRYRMGDAIAEVHLVPSATLKGRSPLAALRTLFMLSRGVGASRTVIRKVRPGVVAGFGGYPTVPPVIAARLAGVPAIIHEQNAVMGRANRLLARFASAIALAFDDTRRVPSGRHRPVEVTGNPVRPAVIEAAATPYRPPDAAGSLRLLVFGGSQGARVFSDTVPEALKLLPAAMRRRLKLVQQCREEDLARVRAAYENAGIDAELNAFFDDLPGRIAAAQLVVARSGASTVAELGVLGRPAILVPLPHALDNDQLENATRLENAGGAWCLSQDDASPERLATLLEQRLGNPAGLKDAAKAARGIGRPDAVARLADFAERLALDRRGRE